MIFSDIKPVFQTRLDEEGTGPGNCMQAVAASFFEVPLEAVPNFIMLPNPDRTFAAFFRERGVELVRKPSDFVPLGIYFVTGLSTQGHEHIVIARSGRVIHDPNPHGRGLRIADGVLWPRPV